MTTMKNYIGDCFPGLMVADGFDDAIIGVLLRPDAPAVVVYDAVAMQEIVMREGVSEEEAIEHLQVNTFGAYVGERTPLYATLEGPRWRR